MISNPSFRSLQVTSERDRVSNGRLREERARLFVLTIQQSLHEMGHGFRAKQSHGDGEVERLSLTTLALPASESSAWPAAYSVSVASGETYASR